MLIVINISGFEIAAHLHEFLGGVVCAWRFLFSRRTLIFFTYSSICYFYFANSFLLLRYRGTQMLSSTSSDKQLHAAGFRKVHGSKMLWEGLKKQLFIG